MDNEIRMAMLCQDHRKDGIRVLQDDALDKGMNLPANQMFLA